MNETTGSEESTAAFISWGGFPESSDIRPAKKSGNTRIAGCFSWVTTSTAAASRVRHFLRSAEGFEIALHGGALFPQGLILLL
jgi:hypothetical protein